MALVQAPERADTGSLLGVRSLHPPVAAEEDAAITAAARGCCPPVGFSRGTPKARSTPKDALGHLTAGFEAHQVLAIFPGHRAASEQ